MAQVKVFGRRSVWAGRTGELSDAIQNVLVAAWGLPEGKRFHRFLLLADDELVAPGRGPAYLVVEVVCFAGRSPDAIRRLVRGLLALAGPLGIPQDDLEVVVLESPPVSWGIRGRVGDVLELDYQVHI